MTKKGEVERYREFLKSGPWERRKELDTDQKMGIPEPPPLKPYPEDAVFVDLISPNLFTIGGKSLIETIKQRRSIRKFSYKSLTLEELSFLLWATQGLNPSIRFRTVPSAGARHPFETYVVIERVEGVKKGLYRYLPDRHKLIFLFRKEGFPERISEVCLGQTFVGEGAVVFIWTVVPYRTEWRYGTLSHKVIAIDAGHLCENLYLAACAIDAGTCAIGAYNQKKADTLLGVDGKDEFVIYLAPVGKLPQ